MRPSVRKAASLERSIELRLNGPVLDMHTIHLKDQSGVVFSLRAHQSFEGFREHWLFLDSLVGSGVLETTLDK